MQVQTLEFAITEKYEMARPRKTDDALDVFSKTICKIRTAVMPSSVSSNFEKGR